MLNLPVAVVFDPAGNMLISDQANDRIRKVDAATQTISTVRRRRPVRDPPPARRSATAAPPPSAFISLPQGQSARPAGRIDIDAAGNLYIADTLNNRVRKIDARRRDHHDRGQRTDRRHAATAARRPRRR